jgi:Leucine-rich repeat (LRR) protein
LFCLEHEPYSTFTKKANFFLQIIIYFRPFTIDFMNNDLLKCNELRKILETNFKKDQLIELCFEISHLNKINLSNNKINTLDINTFTGLNLKYLDLNNNCLEKFDVNIFKDLPNLIELDLSENLFKSFDSRLFNPLVNLKEVIIIYSFILTN